MFKATVKVEGLMCHNCEAHATDAVKRVMAAKSIEASHESGEVIIIAEKIDEDTVRSAIESEGYKVTDISLAPYEKKGFFKKLLGK